MLLLPTNKCRQCLNLLTRIVLIIIAIWRVQTILYMILKEVLMALKVENTVINSIHLHFESTFFWFLCSWTCWGCNLVGFTELKSHSDFLPQNTFHLFFVFTTFLNSCFMLLHSFSSSATRLLMSSILDPPLPFVVFAFRLPPWRLVLWELSRLSETKNHPDIDVRRRSCSKNKTWTTTLRGSLSFWAACVQASNESFWQFISLQVCSLSESVSQGCA